MSSKYGYKMNKRQAKHAWPDELKRKLMEIAGTMPVAEMAKVLKKPEKSVRNMCTRMGLSIKVKSCTN